MLRPHQKHMPPERRRLFIAKRNHWIRNLVLTDLNLLITLSAFALALGRCTYHGQYRALALGICPMMQTWSNWKRFPDVESGEHVEAPIGPGVYEVRHMLSGRLLVFGYAANVANVISSLKIDHRPNFVARMFRRTPFVSRVADLEYRTWAATSRAEAKTAAQRLLKLRHAAWRRRLHVGWAARQ
jgi:hypothetical protein